MTTTQTNLTAYLFVKSPKTSRGIRTLTVYLTTTESLFPSYQGTVEYRPGSTQGEESEIMHYLIKVGKETVPQNYNQYSYYTEIDFPEIRQLVFD